MTEAVKPERKLVLAKGYGHDATVCEEFAPPLLGLWRVGVHASSAYLESDRGLVWVDLFDAAQALKFLSVAAPAYDPRAIAPWDTEKPLLLLAEKNLHEVIVVPAG